MFLRRNRRKARGEDYEYWTLVESVRTQRGPRQRTVATIGKLPGLNKQERIGWEEITRILNGELKHPHDLFEKAPEIPEWATVNIREVDFLTAEVRQLIQMPLWLQGTPL